MDVWSRFERKLGGDIGITWGGELRWTATEGGARELREEVKLMQSWGYPIRLISPGALREMEPGLVAEPITEASFGEAEGHVDTSAVIAAALGQAAELGTKLATGAPVTRLMTETVVSRAA